MRMLRMFKGTVLVEAAQWVNYSMASKLFVMIAFHGPQNSHKPDQMKISFRYDMKVTSSVLMIGLDCAISWRCFENILILKFQKCFKNYNFAYGIK